MRCRTCRRSHDIRSAIAADQLYRLADKTERKIHCSLIPHAHGCPDPALWLAFIAITAILLG